MEELKLYDEVIRTRLEKANDMEAGTKEREVFDRVTVELIQRRNELFRTLSESDASAEQHELEVEKHELEIARLEEEKKNRWTQVALRVAGGIGTTVVLLYVMVSDQIFSETGTTTSIIGKTVLQQFGRPFKK